MARIRTIKPEFWTSEQVMELTPMARLLFIGMWNFCDDKGVHPVAFKTLKAEVFPADDVTAAQVEQWVGEMIEQSLLEIFHDDSGRAWWFVTGWHHQLINRPSKTRYPSPPRNSPQPEAAGNEDSLIDDDDSGVNKAPTHGGLTEDSLSIHGGLTEDSLTEGKGREGSKALSGKPDRVNGLRPESREVLSFLNELTGREYESVESNLEMIACRLREGRSVDQLKEMVKEKVGQWLTDEKMRQYLRPKTLFNATNCAQYIGEVGVGKEAKRDWI